MKIEYRRGDVGLDYHAYRKGVFDCPFCDFVQKYGATERWFSTSQVRAVHFIAGGNLSKKGRAIIVSECPKCFKNSFHHAELTMILRKKWVDKEKVEAEIQMLQQRTLDEWDTSLCKICSVPKKINMNPFGFYVVCDGRMGPPQQPDEKEPFLCTRFKKKEDTKDE